MPWMPKAEAMWKLDPNVTAARKLPGWGAFHAFCGTIRLYFDHIEKEARQYACDAFTLDGRVPVHLAKGRGKTVIDALRDAHDRSGRATAETRRLLDVIEGVPDDDDSFDSFDSFDSLIDEDDLESLL